MTDVKPLVAVLGPGAIGTTMAALLHESGTTPLLFGRRPRPSVELLVDDRHILVPSPVRVDVSEVPAPVDVLFVAVKTTQVDAAAALLGALVGPDTIICALQNGVEQEAILRRSTAAGTVVPSVVWFPAQSEPDGSVRLRGEPRLTLPDTAGGRSVADLLAGTRFSTDLAPDFASVAWRKLIQNAAAGLMVLTGRRAGMFARDDIAELALAYLEECLTVARADGARLGDAVPRDILETFRNYPPDLGTSILADRVAGHPLEWDIRNGVVARRGRAHGIPTPLSDLIVPLLAAASDGPG